jgi:hypothetical protein
VAGCEHRQRGGIAGLGQLVREHRGALSRDLIEHGLRLRDLGGERFDWSDLRDFVAYTPLDSALSAELAGWTRGVRYQNLVETATVNQLRAFQASFTGTKPSIIDLLRTATDSGRRYRKLPISELNKRIGWQ